MTKQVIQNWVTSQVHLSYGAVRDVKYRVFKKGDDVFQEINDIDDSPIHTLELPDRALSLCRYLDPVGHVLGLSCTGRVSVQ